MTINWTNVTTPSQLLNIPNVNTGDSFWTVTTFMVWVVLLVIGSFINFEVGLLFSSFATLIFAVLLVYIGLISWTTTLFFIGMIVFTILYIVWSSNRD